MRASWCDHVAHCSLYPHYRCLPSLMTHSSLCPLLPSPPPPLTCAPQVNARKIHDEADVLAGLGSAPQFLAILGVEAALQVRGTGGEGGGGELP